MTHRYPKRGFLIVSMALLWLCMSQAAYAQGDIDPTANAACEDMLLPVDPPWSNGPSSFTPDLVNCIQSSILQATVDVLAAISKYMNPIVGAAAVLAVAIYGMRIAAGEQEQLQRGIGFMTRLGIVWMFSNNLGGFTGVILGDNGILSGGLIGLTTYGAPPWNTIDQILQNLLGFALAGASGPTLAQGALGMLGGALTASVASTSLGSTLFIPLIVAIVSTILFILDIIYTYLKAVIIAGFMIVISPFLMPLALFVYTEHFVKKWLELLISALVMPMLLFAFVNMALQLLDGATSPITQILADSGGDARVYGRLNRPASAWMKPYDVNQAISEYNTEGGGFNYMSDVQSNIAPLLFTASDQTLNLPGLDFGNDNPDTIAQLMIDFISLWILIAILKQMLMAIPEIAANISGVLTSIGFHRSPPLVQRNAEGKWESPRLNEVWSDMKLGTAVVAGGVVGGEIGSAVGGRLGNASIGRQAGGLLGALTFYGGMDGMLGAMAKMMTRR